MLANTFKTMDQEYVPYEIALELKQLGFDEYCMGACYYEWQNRGKTQIVLHTPDEYDSHDGVKAPLFQQAFRFFREEYGLISEIIWMTALPTHNTFSARIKSSEKTEYMKECDTYEGSELDCLRKLIELVKNK